MMEAPVHGTNFESTVKCSTCAVNVDLSILADHVCATSTTMTETNSATEPTPMSEPQVLHPPRRGASLFRRERPALPKLDSSTSVRSGLDPREAANIAYDLGLPSPLSAGSGRRSPRLPSSRKSSKSHDVHGSRLPDLPLSQDCAFPPFPMSKPKRAQTDRDITYAKPRSASRSTSRAPSRAKTHQTSAANSISSSVHSTENGAAMKRVTSQSSSAQRSRQGTLDENTSVPSTTPSSPILSASSNSPSRRNSDETSFPLPGLEPLLANITPDTSNSASPATPSQNLPEPTLPSKMTQSPSSKGDQRETREAPRPLWPAHKIIKPEDEKTNPAVTFDNILHSEQTQAQASNGQVREASYKSKRPPALAQQRVLPATDQEGPRSARLPIAPLGNSIGRTITSLFGRKRSQSVSSKKMPKPDFDSPRMRALAPEVPEIPKRIDGEFGVPNDSYFPAMPAITQQEKSATAGAALSILSSPLQSPLVRTSNTPSNGLPVEETHGDIVKQVNHAGEQQFDFSFNSEADAAVVSKTNSIAIEQDLDAKVATIVPTELTTAEDDLRRTSVDSASSYGSVGFSNRTTSSRSSLPPSEEARNKLSLTSEPDYTTTISMDHIAPLSPQFDNLVPGSPIDASYQPGGLSPILETPSSRWSNAAEACISPEKLHRVPSRLDSLSPRIISSAASSRPTTPAGTKGICRGCSQTIMAGQKSVSSKDGRLTGRYHKDCFACRTCKNTFATADFYVHNDEPYCSHDYHVINNTLCVACGKGIEGQYLETFDATGNESKKFHSRCLTCSTCRIQLGDDYFEFQGRIYCERDAFRAANGPKSPYDNAPSRPSPLVREVINSSEPGLRGRFPERRTTRLMMI